MKFANTKTFLAALSVAVLALCAFSSVRADDDDYKIMSYNVRNCKGMDNQTDYARVADVINRERPDVVALQELDSKTNRSKGVDVLEELAKLTNMTPSFGPAIDYQGGKYGVGILTKEKPISVKYYSLPGSEEQRCLLMVELRKYVFCCSHWSLTQKDRDETVKIIREKLREQKKPCVICGDFNAEPNEDSIKELKKDWTLLNREADFTFPSDKPSVHIDYICAADPTGRISPREWKDDLERDYVVAEPVASDHRPVVVVVDEDVFDEDLDDDDDDD
ncbi:MAG: endonuclease/exonuclease/phosphatase family protein [Thermoguttaceae bacterium]|nr:endonuclease/exonuclease/phosphatase family protein [Thermoguttaceae bacterium]